MITFKKYFFIILVFFTSINIYAQCNGSANCSTCTNCVRCKHCKAGGVCGVCSPESFKSKNNKPKINEHPSNSNKSKKDSLKITNTTPVIKSSSETIIKEEKKDIYTVVQVMPEFPGGNLTMQKYIQENLIIPKIVTETGLKGKCFTRFVIEKDGSIGEVKIIKGLAGCPECDEEAKKVLQNMPKWKPGLQSNQPVPVYFNLPINFQPR